jgi:hypothetical protein
VGEIKRCHRMMTGEGESVPEDRSP